MSRGVYRLNQIFHEEEIAILRRFWLLFSCVAHGMAMFVSPLFYTFIEIFQ